MVDSAILADKIASVRDAVARIREVLPAKPDAFRADRTAREVVILNLFIALQDCLSLAAHWLSDAGIDVPQSYAQAFLRLGDRASCQRIWRPGSPQRRGFAIWSRTATARSTGIGSTRPHRPAWMTS